MCSERRYALSMHIVIATSTHHSIISISVRVFFSNKNPLMQNLVGSLTQRCEACATSFLPILIQQKKSSRDYQTRIFYLAVVEYAVATVVVPVAV